MSPAPFVILDDARPGGRALRFLDPIEIVEARDPDAIPACLERLAQAGPLHAAGFLSYEVGHAIEPKLAPLRRAAAEEDPPLLWFGLFERYEEGSAADWLSQAAGAWAGAPRPLVSPPGHRAAVASVLDHIFEGDIYQANLTFSAEVPVVGDPRALYAGIRERARGGHGALVFTGSHWLLSFSPELFFTLRDGRILTRPMKGTATRGRDDEAAVEALRRDPKQRAENLMIVDLLRNDLARVARTGTVAVPDLFAVETYPTVHQMTSTVTAELDQDLGPVDLLRAIFPCGSITGAPKLRAMEIIAEVEKRPRGVYTGAIGRIGPGGEADFNVAIRTLVLREGESRALMGLGSGIVADSRAGDEWRECLAKGAFVADPRRFDLIETMRFDPHDGIADLDRHLARMKRSAEALGFVFDRHHARNELQAASFGVTTPGVARLLLSRSGALAIEVRPLPSVPEGPVEVALAPLGLASDDFRLRHKTTDRAFYDEARIASGAFEVLFTDPGGFLTEGSFTNLFVRRGGRLATPPLARGLLPGVLRERLIDSGEAMEEDLVPADLADGFLIGNAARGLIPAILR